MAEPESAPPSRPPLPAATRDLTSAEFAELGELLAGIPEPLAPLGLDMADGFLVGVAVQPQRVDPEQWLRFVFDEQGHRWGEATPSPERQRAGELLLRRLAALERELAEFGDVDPWLLEAPDDVEPGRELEAVLQPWLAGFFDALEILPLEDAPGEAVVEPVLARLQRYLDEPMADRPPTIEAAIADVMLGIGALYVRAEDARYRVETVRRETAKVGRNDPCPCGSGRKFKHCHGAA